MDIINYTAWQKAVLSPLDNFRPENLARLKRAPLTGYLDMKARMHMAMYHDWDALLKDTDKMANAAASLSYRAVPATRDGEAPDALAQEVADTVNAALWRQGEAEAGTWSHTFPQLIASCYHALCRGYDVHEICWGCDAELAYPRCYKPVPPTYFGWASGARQRDRLLLYRNGNLRGPGEEFPQRRFIIALNANGPDHPVCNALYDALIPYFGAAKWGVAWFMEYTQIFGKPLRKFKGANPEELDELQKAVRANPVLTDVFVTEPNDVEILQAAAGGANIPQAVLIDLAERACHKLILGQTLTSDTSANGGSLAQARVHAGVLADEILAVGNFICDTLNAQLIPAIVARNYGRTEGLPLPELRCSVPNGNINLEKVRFYAGMLDLGMDLVKSDVYDDLGQRIPGAGDETLSRAAAPAPGAMPAMPGAPMDAISAAAAARQHFETNWQTPRAYADRAEALAAPAAALWLDPVLRKIEHALDAGEGPGRIKTLLAALRAGTHDLAGGMAACAAAPLQAGGAEPALAANTRGCNGAEHKPGCPQSGLDAKGGNGYNSQNDTGHVRRQRERDGGGSPRRTGSGEDGDVQRQGKPDPDPLGRGSGTAQGGMGRRDVYAEMLGRFEKEAPEYDTQELRIAAMQAAAQPPQARMNS